MTKERLGVEDTRSKPRTLEIEILRLWCTLAVCLHHLRYCSESLPYGGGYIAVDFFFMVSGFYLRQSYIEKKGADIGVLEFVKKRYIRLYKDYIIAFVIGLLVSLSVFETNIGGNISWYIREAFMLEVGNVESGLRINPPGWYCGYLLLGSTIVFLFQKIIKRWIGSLSLILGFLLYLLLAFTQGHLCIFPRAEGINWFAVLRAVAGLLIGVFIFEAYKKKNSMKVSELTLKIFFFLGVVIISYMLFWNTAFNSTDYIVLPIFVILIYASQFIKINFLSGIDDEIWKQLSQLVYIVFLNHYVIVKLIKYFNLFNYWDWKLVSAFYIFIIFVVSCFLLRIREMAERLMFKRRCMNEKQ